MLTENETTVPFLCALLADKQEKSSDPQDNAAGLRHEGLRRVQRLPYDMLCYTILYYIIGEGGVQSYYMTTFRENT